MTDTPCAGTPSSDPARRATTTLADIVWGLAVRCEPATGPQGTGPDRSGAAG